MLKNLLIVPIFTFVGTLHLKGAITVSILDEAGGVRVTVAGQLDESAVFNGSPLMSGGLTPSSTRQQSSGANFVIGDGINAVVVNSVGNNSGEILNVFNGGATINIEPLLQGPGLIFGRLPGIVSELYFNTANDVGISQSYFDAPQLNSQLIAGETLASLGFIDGAESTAEWNWAISTITGPNPGDFTTENFSDSITFRVGAPVPEPSSLLFCLLGAMPIWARRRVSRTSL